MAIGGIAVLALIPRLLLTFAIPPILHLDSESYFEIAQTLWNSGTLGDLSRRMPLYPLLLAALGRSPRAGLFPVVAVQHLFGVASAVLVYLIVRRVFCPRNQVLAAVAGSLVGIAIFPAILEHSILSESLFTLLALGAAYFSIAWLQERQTSTAVTAGAALGLATLTRPIAAGIFAVSCAYILMVLGAKRGLRFVLLGGAAFLVLVLPLMVRNHYQHGSFALTDSLGRNLISVTDMLVDYEHGVHPQIKAIYRDFLADKRGPDAVVVYAAMPRLRSAMNWSDVQIDRALADIAWEAIKAQPLQYLAGAARRLPLLFRPAGGSQWYALHAETYLPVVEFVGRSNPDLVSRSVAVRGLRQARFGLAEWTFRTFGMDLTSGWLVLFVVLGMLAATFHSRREAGLLITLLGFLWIATVLLQPPNGRYRLPTLGLEILFAAVGWWSVVQVLLRIFHRKSEKSMRTGQPTTPWMILVIVAVTLATVGVRAALASSAKPVLDIVTWQKQWQHQGGAAGLQIRDVPMAGRTVPVLYWNGNAGAETASAPQSVSARVPVSGGPSYDLRAAYSCQRWDCSGAMLRFTFVDSGGAALPDGISQSLAQQRSDNDLFWDQLEMEISVPGAARQMSVEFAINSEGGNLVIPYLSVQ